MTDTHLRFPLLVFTLLLIMAGCSSKDIPAYHGRQYPASNTVIPVFQAGQVPVSCRVFSQMLVWLPENSTGKSIAQAIEQEAISRGADVLLIGKSREASDDEGLLFTYYETAKEENCREQWPGWKFGYDVWSQQGDWVSFGYNEWGNADIQFNTPIILQAAFLRCQ